MCFSRHACDSRKYRTRTCAPYNVQLSYYDTIILLLTSMYSRIVEYMLDILYIHPPPPQCATYLWEVDSMRRTDPRWSRDHSDTRDCGSARYTWHARRTLRDKGLGICFQCMQVEWDIPGGWSTQACIQRRGRPGGRVGRCRRRRRRGQRTAHSRRTETGGTGREFPVWV